ncbi:hypothetical protein ICV01_06255 [Polynucleobacter sp. MWH-Spelu-300-X4]|uniref:hypothetical protein n=1 Tax=Polynucleobacter sp. MWH-Spelu-300-X4 TaxID=2689109 RepID=UPI001BFDFEC9|nr:hypothetical protein [Polynucleobacter sp. MWH-Spelu-300-X4]QWD79250.1 hypothetical protein ICV01_06255 [Polynucleobacter sp. MWH-Spelu-300-X4]
MDFLSFIKNEFFRPLSTLIIPGGIAFAPWAILIALNNQSILDLVKTNNGIVITIFLSLSLVIGMLLEDLGSRIELLCDGCLYKRDPEAENRWFNYLKLELKDEVIGQRYLRTLLVRLKFELAILPSITISFIGFCILNTHINLWESSSLVIAGSLVAILDLYLGYEIWQSVQNLDMVRELIIESKEESNANKED